MRAIVQKGAPVLRQKAQNIPPEKISSKEIQGLIKDLKQALAKEEDGVAIAAPQVGESLRLFVVSGKVFKSDADPAVPPDKVFINPTLVKQSRRKSAVDEGCLSVRHFYGTVKRSVQATVRALDEQGATFELGGSGLLAQIFQHELDHLDGILFVDKAEKSWEENPPASHYEAS